MRYSTMRTTIVLAALIVGLSGCATFQPAPSFMDEPLMQAIRTGDAQGVREALAQSPELNPACQPYYNCKPLTHAARAGHIEIVRMLVEAGADPNGLGTYGDTAFHYAYEGLVTENPKRLRIIWRYLLENGTDPNQPNSFGYSPFVALTMTGNIALMELALTKGADPVAKLPVSARSPGRGKRYVDDGNISGHPDNDPLYAIAQAAREDQTEAVRWLLEHGADPHFVDASEKSALGWAQENENDEMIRLIKAARRK